MFEWTNNGLNVTVDLDFLNSLWQWFLNWGWMAVFGIVMLGVIWKVTRNRIAKAKESHEAYMNERLPGAWRALHESLKDLGNSQARLTVMTVFLENAKEQEIPLLPVEGVSMILEEGFRGTNKYSYDIVHIQSLLKALISVQ